MDFTKPIIRTVQPKGIKRLKVTMDEHGITIRPSGSRSGAVETFHSWAGLWIKGVGRDGGFDTSARKPRGRRKKNPLGMPAAEFSKRVIRNLNAG